MTKPNKEILQQIDNALLLNLYRSRHAFALRHEINPRTFNLTIHRIIERGTPPKSLMGRKIVQLILNETGFDLLSKLEGGND